MIHNSQTVRNRELSYPRRARHAGSGRVPALGVVRSRNSVSSLLVFTARAEARALLYAACMMNLHEAVDGLWAAVERNALLDEAGADAMQAILASAFGAVR